MSIRLMTDVWDRSPYDRALLLIHLAMADFANDAGAFYASQPVLAEKARVSVEYVRQAVERMVADGLLVVTRKGTRRGRATEYLLTPLPPKLVGGSADPVPDSPPNQVGEDPPTLTDSPPNSAPSQPSYTTVLGEEQSGAAAPALARYVELNEAFAAFWAAYPRRVGRQAARKAWQRAVATVSPEVILEAARRFAADPNRSPLYTPHPTTWLNQGRWDDDPLPSAAHTSGAGVYLSVADALGLDPNVPHGLPAGPGFRP